MISSLIDEPYWPEFEDQMGQLNLRIRQASFHSILNYLIHKKVKEFENYNLIFPNSVDLINLDNPDFDKIRVYLIQKIRAYILVKCQRQKSSIVTQTEIKPTFINIIKDLEDMMSKENNLELVFKVMVIARESHSRITSDSELKRYIDYILNESTYLT